MSGIRRGVRGRRIAWGIVLSLLVVSITLVSAGVALADKWTDITDAQWQSQYGVTAAQAATVAAGFQDGSFHPKEAVKRGQFAKMVVDGFGVSTYSPSVATFPDVAKTNTFFKYIEGGVKAGIISGYSDGTFKPNNTISRQQANNILGAYLSDKELDENGVITGSKGTYGSLSAWYGAEGALILAAYKDAAKVAAVHAPGTAYLVYHEVVKGSNGNLTPGSTLTRAQAVALIIRVREADFGSGAMPTVTGVSPAAGSANGGNGVIITGTNFTSVASVKFGGTSSVFTVNSATQITATAPPGTTGTTVDIIVTTTAGSSVAGNLTKYSYGAPVITQLSPSGGSSNGNTTVAITGTGFTGVTAVKFGLVAAKTFTVVSPTLITAVSPAGTSGTVVDVTVTNPAGTSATGTATKYTYGVPTVTKLDPAAGPAAGGNTVVITGSGFADVTGASGVKFGNVNATSYTVNTNEKITAVAPAGTTGTTVDVVVSNNIGQSSTSGMESKYSYGPPTITKINPTGGSELGGETVTITGSGFTGVTAVKFGNVNAKSFVVSTPTTMTAVAPAGTSGTTVEVYVTTPAGTNSSAGTANDYSYGVPSITALNPAAGPVAGNNTVIITGTNFVGLTLADQVKFGGKTALSYTVNSSTQITAVAPAGTSGTTVAVVVTNAAGASLTSAASMYSYGLPTVSTIDPAAGPLSGGNQVIINGTGFTGVSAVKFGGTSVSYTVNSATKITATAPAGALDTIVDVTVTTPAGVSVSSDATSDTTDNTKYRYILSPSVSSIDPISGPTEGGNIVTVTGTYFVKGFTTVKFGSKSATDVNVISDTELTCKAPSGTSGSIVSVIVINPVGQSPNTAADDYAYGIPTVMSLNPPARASLSGTSTVIITGTAFAGVTSVRFYYDVSDPNRYVPAESFTVNSLTQITAVVPAWSDTMAEDDPYDKTVDVIVTNATGSSDAGPASKFTYGAPHIDSLTPAGGTAAGGNSVVIKGYGFTGTAGSMSVMFGDTPATITAINTTRADNPATIGYDESLVECTEVTVTVPPQGSMVSPVNVTVTTAAGISNSKSYSYGIPTVTGLTPKAGLNSGGNSVVITGTGFTGTTAVSFGGDAATSFNVDSSTQITAIAPNGDDNTTVDVRVTNTAGQSANTSADDYSFGAPVVTSLTPSGGAAGTTVVIKGTGFTGVQSVKFIGSTTKTATIVSVNPDYTNTSHGAPQAITVTAPTGLSGTVDVRVTTDAGMSADTAADDYSYGLPTISSIVPAAGKTTGGTTVVINGTNFDPDNCTVYFDGVAVDPDNVTVNSDVKITVLSPAYSTLPSYAADDPVVDVEVENTSGKSLTGALTKYSYGAPVVTGLDPTGGLAAGGNTVKIYGKGFTGVTGVKFGSKSATSVVVDTDTLDNTIQMITVVAPSGTSGTTVNVTVTNAYATSSDAGAADDYTYGIPTVTGLNPAAGVATDLVIITGTNFTGVTEVFFGSIPATVFAVNSATQITAQVPVGTGTVDVRVQNGAALSAISAADKFSYGAPTITDLSPDNGTAAGGTTVRIYGTGFTGITSVMFGDTAASNINVDETTLGNAIQEMTVRAPAGVVGTTVTVTITTAGGTSATGDEGDIYEPWDYHYSVPTISSLKEGSGTAGDDVLITGTNFTSDAKVFFGATEVPHANIDYSLIPSKLTVTVPAHADGTVDVTVVTGAGASPTSLLNSKFTYGAPTITAVSPSSGVVGTTVVITGSGFTGVKSVKFTVGGTIKTATVVSIDSTTQMKVTAPSGLTGTASITITTYGGEYQELNAFTYLSL